MNPQRAREVTEGWSDRRAQSLAPKTVAVFIHSGGKDVAVNKDARSRLYYRDASDRRNERSNATARATFREGSTHQPTTLRSVLMASPPRTGYADMRFKLTLE